jgi:hypothetical protein
MLKLLPISRPSRLLILFCTALFPLSTWVAGSVQPDVLSFALIMSSLWAVLRITESTFTQLTKYLLLGLSLGALLATKPHLFAIVLCAVLARLAPLWFPLTSRWQSGILALLALAVPSFAAYAIFEPPLQVPAALKFCGASTLDVFQTVRATHTEFSAFKNAVSSVFDSSFFFGTAMKTFWLGFGSGYHVNLISYGGPAIDDLVIAAIVSLTLLVFTLVIARLIAVLARLALLYRAGRRVTFWRLLTGNVLVTTFFLYCLELLAVEFIGGPSLQGRYWWPLLPAIWYLAFVFAPQSLPRTWRAPMVGLLSSLILAFSAVTAVLAYPHVVSRYYVPARTNPVEEVLGGFDPISVPAPPSQSYSVTGVAVDYRDFAPPLSVSVLVDGRWRIPAEQYDRFRFACSYSHLAILRSGFRTQIPVSRIGSGPHEFEVLMRVPWSREELRVGDARPVTHSMTPAAR